jgi:hypothetical protein
MKDTLVPEVIWVNDLRGVDIYGAIKNGYRDIFALQGLQLQTVGEICRVFDWAVDEVVGLKFVHVLNTHTLGRNLTMVGSKSEGISFVSAP